MPIAINSIQGRKTNVNHSRIKYRLPYKKCNGYIIHSGNAQDVWKDCRFFS